MEDQYIKKILTYDQLSKTICKYFTAGLSEEENALFNQWLNDNDNIVWWTRIEQKEELLNGLKSLSKIKQNDEEYLTKLHSKILAISQSNVTWWQAHRTRLLIAASLIAIIGSVALWNRLKTEDILQSETVTKSGLISDAEPGKFKARLTLANGSIIILDSTSEGKLAEEGKTVVLNNKGRLIYRSSAKELNRSIFNVLTTEKGQLYATILSDGTKAWLNSASSLRYPVAFNDKVRKVELTGEAYFEVTPETKPFIVSVNDMEIEVLGTHFNVNAYSDEPEKKTTLLSGKVKISSTNTGQQTVLSPGQQAKIDNNGTIKPVLKINTQQVIAWKNGYFHFIDQDITSVMRQLARWYNLDVVYEGQLPKLIFGGKLPRNTKASVVLRVLEKYNVHFKIEGKKIIVSP